MMSQETAGVQQLISSTRQQIGSKAIVISDFFKNKNMKTIDFCTEVTRENCNAKRRSNGQSVNGCSQKHYREIITSLTDRSLGNCSYLDTCRHMEYCRFVHFKLDEPEDNQTPSQQLSVQKPKQWINCDLRDFDLTVLGECGVIMLDPPWDIHMSVGSVSSHSCPTAPSRTRK